MFENLSKYIHRISMIYYIQRSLIYLYYKGGYPTPTETHHSLQGQKQKRIYAMFVPREFGCLMSLYCLSVCPSTCIFFRLTVNVFIQRCRLRSWVIPQRIYGMTKLRNFCFHPLHLFSTGRVSLQTLIEMRLIKAMRRI